MKTPSKQPESSSMTREEEEEMLHDISKLQDGDNRGTIISIRDATIIVME